MEPLRAALIATSRIAEVTTKGLSEPSRAAPIVPTMRRLAAIAWPKSVVSEMLVEAGTIGWERRGGVRDDRGKVEGMSDQTDTDALRTENAALRAEHAALHGRGAGRWEPNARGRLEQAALELYGERGFDQTTVAQIAMRAGLTERTFFRHFVDKREVLFWGAGALQELLVGAVADAPAPLLPLDAVAAGLVAVAAPLQERRELARQRQRIIVANAELHERELIKLATLASALADTLRRRGVEDPAASLAAEAGIAVFKIAFERWVDETNQRDFRELIRESFATLKAVTAGG